MVMIQQEQLLEYMIQIKNLIEIKTDEKNNNESKILPLENIM